LTSISNFVNFFQSLTTFSHYDKHINIWHGGPDQIWENPQEIAPPPDLIS